MNPAFGNHHVIFSTENPTFEMKITPPPVDAVVKWLKDQGEDAHKAFGFYRGQAENTVLVKNPKNLSGLKQLAEDTGQETFLSSKDGKHELHYVNGPDKGKVIHGHGTVVHAKPPEDDFYTSIPDEHGDLIHFTHNLNVPKQTTELQKDVGAAPAPAPTGAPAPSPTPNPVDQAMHPILWWGTIASRNRRKKKKLHKAEDLVKAPMPYDAYDPGRTYDKGLPDFQHHLEYKPIKAVTLPNGLEYRQFHHRHGLEHNPSQVHALYHPSDPHEPMAYMETIHQPDNDADAGYHPHVVKWSEVHPELRGHGIGRQLYLATLLHGTGRLTSDEMVSPEAHKMWQSFKSYSGLGGRIAPYGEWAGPGPDPSQRHQLFIRDKTKLNKDLMFPPLSILNNKLAASEKELEESFSKAIDDRSWNRIIKAHNKAAPEGNAAVDAAGHIAYFNKSHDDYKNAVLYSDKPHKAEPLKEFGGASPKVIHTVSDDDNQREDRFMAKPYHVANERWAKSWSKHPIKGWASLTSRKLFEAADMGDNSEDLAAHIHKGVPIVVSKFHANAEPTHEDPQLIPTTHAQIAVMDFLMNNQDRHRGNMMHVNGNPIAIDHERNFQYFDRKPGFDPVISPGHALQSWSDYKSHIQTNDGIISGHLLDWWGKNAHNIKKEMQKNLQFIKDPAIKQHIANNFKARWEWVNNRMEQDPILMFDKNVPGEYPHPFHKERKKK